MKRLGLLGIAIIASLILSDYAQAGPIFSSVWAGAYTNFGYNADGSYFWDTGQPWSGDVVSGTTVGSQTASAVNSGGTYNGATANSSGSANLSLAALKGSENASLAPGASASNARTTLQSAFADSFSVFGASGPFSWTSADTVRFTFTVNGHIDPSSDISGFSVFFGAGPATGLANDTGGGLPGFPAGQVGGIYAPHLAFLGIGSNDCIGATCGGTLIMSAAGDVSGTAFAEFAPNGNFDWEAGLELFAWPGEYPSEPLSSSMNFSNTVSVGYTGPAGTTTYSLSGVFPGTLDLSTAPTAVPEPATMLLLGSGLIGLVGYGRKKFLKK